MLRAAVVIGALALALPGGGEEPVPVARIVQQDRLMFAGERILSAWQGTLRHRHRFVHIMPLPPASQAPKLDAKLDDPCWQRASRFVDLIDCLGFPAPTSPDEIYACRDAKHIFVAIRSVEPCKSVPNGEFSMQVGKKRIHMRFHRDRIVYREGPRWLTLLKHAASVTDAKGGLVEMMIPVEKLFGVAKWDDATISLTPHRGTIMDDPLRAGTPVYLAPADIAWRMAPVQPGAAMAGLGGRKFTVEMHNLGGAPAKLEATVVKVDGATRDKPAKVAASIIELTPGESRSVEVPYLLGSVADPSVFVLTTKLGKSKFQCASLTAMLPVARAIEGLKKAVATPALVTNSRHAARWNAELKQIQGEHDTLRSALAQNEDRLTQWTALFHKAHAIKREVMLSAVPPGLDEILFVKRYPYTAGGRYFTTHYHYEPGGHNLSVFSIRSSKVRDILDVPDGTAIRDPDLHFSGSKIVFAARNDRDEEVFPGITNRHKKIWSIYEVDADGTGLKSITQSGYYDLEPIYLSDDSILFGSLRSGCWGCCTGHSAYNFFTMDGDGSNIRRFTANYLYDVSPSLLPDGRIAFLRWVHEDKPGNHINALWAVRQDASHLTGLYGMNVYGCTIEPRGIPGTGEVVCIDSGSSGHWRLPQNGNLAIISEGHDQGRFLHRVPTPLSFGGRWGFKTPYPLTRDLFLTSFGHLRTGFGVYLVDRAGNMEILYKHDKLSSFNAVPFQPRPRPPHLASHLKAKSPDEPCTLTLLNVYEGQPEIPRGTIKAIRVVQVLDKTVLRSGNSGYADQTNVVSDVYRMARHVVGTAPVQADGSAQFDVPPGKAIYFQILDERGLMVQTMRDTTSFAPGERQTCVGCHDSRLDAPPAAQAPAQALQHPASRLEPLSDGRFGVDYPRDIQPIFDRHCVKCHDLREPKGGIVLCGDVTRTFCRSYETLSKHNRDRGHSMHPGPTKAIVPVITYVAKAIAPRTSGAYGSPLFKKHVFGNHHDAKLSAEEIRTLALWVDLNLPYYEGWTQKRYGGGRNIDLVRDCRDTITEVMKRRCMDCHAKRAIGLDVGKTVNLTRPELSPILRAALAPEAGGTAKDKMIVFKSRQDPDYQKILSAIMKTRQSVPVACRECDAGPG